MPLQGSAGDFFFDIQQHPRGCTMTVHSMLQIVCGCCGSNQTRRDAWAEWDVAKQDWVLGNVFDDGACENCEDTSSLEEVELTEVYPVTDWQYEIANGDTQLGYKEWLIAKGEAHGDQPNQEEE
jgi:hypothetical protein